MPDKDTAAETVTTDTGEATAAEPANPTSASPESDNGTSTDSGNTSAPAQDGDSKTETESPSNGFKPPATQEDFDRMVKERLARQEEKAREKIRAEFEGYLPPDKAKELSDTIEELKKAATNAGRENAAMRAGLDPEMGQRLLGASADDWAKDAAELAGSLAAKAGLPGSGLPRERRGFGGLDPSASGVKNPREEAKAIPRI